MTNQESTKSNKKNEATCKMCDGPLPTSANPKLNPFCSERCRLQDLSKWFGENYRIASHQSPATKDESSRVVLPEGSET